MVPSPLRKLVAPYGNMFEHMFFNVRRRVKHIVDRRITNRKSSGKEENEFNVIVSELKKLEQDFSTDVAVLREQIELASLDFTDAQKRFDKLEKEYIAAKLEMFVKKERKDQLTTHLYSFIKRNEIEKAKTISGFVGKLELAPCPMEKLITEPVGSCEKEPQEDETSRKASEDNMAQLDKN